MRRWFLRVPVSLLLVLVSGLLVTGFGGALPVAAVGTTIVNDGANKCLDMTGGSLSNGTQPQIWTCNGSRQQDWLIIPVGSPFFLIENVNSGKCLSILHNSTGVNATVIQWTCNFSGNDPFEDWRQSSSSPPFELLQGSNGNPFAMETSGCHDTRGTKIVMGRVCGPEALWS
jgi:hypothetical protein